MGTVHCYGSRHFFLSKVFFYFIFFLAICMWLCSSFPYDADFFSKSFLGYMNSKDEQGYDMLNSIVCLTADRTSTFTKYVELFFPHGKRVTIWLNRKQYLPLYECEWEILYSFDIIFTIIALIPYYFTNLWVVHKGSQYDPMEIYCNCLMFEEIKVYLVINQN